MPSSAVLDVAIGMVFIYLLLSLMATAVQEIIAAVLKMRARNLENGILSLLSDGIMRSTDASGVTTSTSLAKLVYNHGLIRGLYRDPAVDHQTLDEQDVTPVAEVNRKNLPSYIPSRTFAVALMHILNPGNHSGPWMFPAVQQTVGALPDSKAKQAIEALVNHAAGDVDQLRTNIEHWYESAMDRASGWYKRTVQYWLLGIGLTLAVVFNVDSFHIAQALWQSPQARQELVTVAEAYRSAHPQAPAPGSVKEDTPPIRDLNERLKAANENFRQASDVATLPVGWKDLGARFKKDRLDAWLANSDPVAWLMRLKTLIGWLLTAIALSLGAPFWFDLLNKFMVVRSTIKPHEKSLPEAPKG